MAKKEKAKIEIEAHWGVPPEITELIKNCPDFNMSIVRKCASRTVDRAVMDSLKMALEGRGHSPMLNPKFFRSMAVWASAEVLKEPQLHEDNVFGLGLIVEYHIVADDLSERVKWLQAP